MTFDSVAWQVFGRAHFLVLHFPIALVMLVALLEFTAPLWDRRAAHAADGDDDEDHDGPVRGRRSHLPLFILLLATLGAAVAAGSGWVYADNEVVSNAAIDLHRWFGVGAAAAVLVALIGRLTMPRWLYLVVLLIATVGTGVTGHLGGELVHGQGFLLAPLGSEDEAGGGSAVTAPPGEEADPLAGEPAAVKPEAAPEPIVRVASFDADVYPILDANCIRCHGAERQKGGVRVDGRAFVDELIRAGNPDRSLLIEVVEHDPSHPMHMPRNEESLPADQVAALRAWVASLSAE